jgi:hypothetical protein
MFDIFFKRKKIVVDCFTTNINAYDMFRLAPAVQHFPEWWKQLSKLHTDENKHGLTVERSSMKRCQGFMDLYTAGFVMPLWSDVVIQTRNLEYNYQFADSVSSISYHDIAQLGGEFQNFVHVKLKSPWRLQEKTGVKFMFTEPTWNSPSDLLDYSVLPGALDFKYQYTTHVNVFLRKGQRYDWSAGRALAHIIPLSDHEVELKFHLVAGVDENVMRVMDQNSPFFQRTYKKIKDIRDNTAAGKCPFKL